METLTNKERDEVKEKVDVMFKGVYKIKRIRAKHKIKSVLTFKN